MASIEDFKNKAQEFMVLFSSLAGYDVSQYPPALQAQYLELMDRGGWLKYAIEAFTNSIDFAAGAYDSILDFFGLRSSDEGLSAVPVGIAVGGAAGVGAAVLLLTKWIKDAKLIKRRLDEVARLVEQGVPPEEAHAIVLRTTTTGGPGIIGGAMQALWPMLLFGGAVYLFANARR